jgi:hypothetical protein
MVRGADWVLVDSHADILPSPLGQRLPPPPISPPNPEVLDRKFTFKSFFLGLIAFLDALPTPSPPEYRSGPQNSVDLQTPSGFSSVNPYANLVNPVQRNEPIPVVVIPVNRRW